MLVGANTNPFDGVFAWSEFNKMVFLIICVQLFFGIGMCLYTIHINLKGISGIRHHMIVKGK